MAKKDEVNEGPSGEAVPTIDPWEVLDRMSKALEALTARQETAPDTRIEGLINTLAPALARLAEAQVEGSKLIADETRRAHRPSNETVPQRSVFNRRGVLLNDQHPEGVEGPVKPPLKCLMMIPWLVEWESCTREEVELLNLLEPGEYLLKRIDNSKVKVNVQVEYRVNGKPSRLIMTHDTAFNNDNFRMLPPFADMLRQILKQHDYQIAQQAALVMSDEEEEALIEAGELAISA